MNRLLLSVGQMLVKGLSDKLMPMWTVFLRGPHDLKHFVDKMMDRGPVGLEKCQARLERCERRVA